MADYRRQLDEMFAAAETAAVQERIMFGSDWFMEALHPQADQFLTQYEAFFGDWGSKDVEGFLGRRALEFLGFDDSQNQNAQRLRRRYEQYAPDNIPTWLAA